MNRSASAVPAPPNFYRRELAIFLALAGFTYLTIARDLSDPNHGNVWSRLSLMFAVVEKGKLNIDDYIGGGTEDWSRYDGHYYSNKAPAPALIAAPFYFVQYRIERAFQIDPRGPLPQNIAQYVANLVSTVIPTLIALALLWVVLLRRYALPPWSVALLCAAWAVGSLALVYTVLFFGHQTAAAFFCIGMCISLLEVDQPRPRRLFVAGLAMGIAVAADYICAQFVVVWTL